MKTCWIALVAGIWLGGHASVARAQRVVAGTVTDQRGTPLPDADIMVVGKDGRDTRGACQHPGLVIFSSGSTGAPKAILHDLTHILEKFRKVRQQKTTLTFLLFDHIGGIDTMLNTFGVSAGVRLVSTGLIIVAVIVAASSKGAA